MILRAILTLSLSCLLFPLFVPGILASNPVPVPKGKPPLKRFTFREKHMGTTCALVVHASSEAQAHKASKAAFARIAEINGIMSDYDPTSELMRLCARAGGEPVKVSGELFTVLQAAQQLSHHSQGAFDVSVGPVVHLWRKARRTGKKPDPRALALARKLVNYKNIILDSVRRTVQLKQKGMVLDLGGIAKGYAADQALQTLKKTGLSRCLVVIGGDLVVGDPPPGAQHWTVGIAPLARHRKPLHYIPLHNAAASTSGDREQFVILDGKRYSHIIDLRTGKGVPGRFSVTVVAPDAITTDSLATAISIIGPERAKKLIQAYPRTSFRHVSKIEELKVTVSKGFPLQLTPGRGRKEDKVTR